MKQFLFSLFLFFGLLPNVCRCQIHGRYVIISFDHYVSFGMHGLQRYYWIFPTDSIKPNHKIVLCKLLRSDYSQEDLAKCCNGIEIDPKDIRQTPHFSFSQKHYDELQHFDDVVLKRRKRLATVKKSWQYFSNRKEYLRIFITPVTGNFCFSPLAKTGEKATGYSGNIYIPISSFEYDKTFWDDEKAKSILTHDFAGMEYWMTFTPY